MGKNPAFLFYPSDFIMGTTTFSYDQKGKYVDLLCIQFSKEGYIPERDVKKILNFENTDDLEVLEKFRLSEEGKYFNIRLLAEINKRKTYSKKQSVNAQKRWNKSKDAIAMPSHKVGNAKRMPLENTNTNENINVFKDVYGNYKHVNLTTEEYELLKVDFKDYEDKIQRLDIYMETSGRNYNNHDALIREWARQDTKKIKKDNKNKPKDIEVDWLEDYINQME